jgi:hypothetical protein
MLCGKAGFEPKTLAYQAERNDHCATRPIIKLQSAGSPEGFGPPVTRPLPVKQTSNAPSMSSSELGSDASSS